MQNPVFETVIGLEVHVQLATKSKAFCRDAVVFGAAPNTAVSVVSLAHPGTLPVANKNQIAYAVRLGLALGSQINLYNAFDRKNYFYADSPRGYQITQDRVPILVGGVVQIGTRSIRIHHVHMEDDAGKSLHDQHPTLSYVDLNRAGTPLLEIVTEPDFRSAAEVAEFMEYLRHLVRWIEISDGNMEEGSLRCDVNISLRPLGDPVFGQRCEVKNMNSMRFAKKAIEYEVQRQTRILSEGGQVMQQTRGFNPSDGSTYALRDKEDAHDYRYFPDPDLPPVRITEQMVTDIAQSMGDLPQTVRARCADQYGLTAQETEAITSDRAVAAYYEQLVQGANPQLYKPIAQLLIQKIKPMIESQGTDYHSIGLNRAQIQALVQMIVDGNVQHSAAYQVLWPALIAAGSGADVVALATQLGIVQTGDALDLTALAQTILDKYPDKVKEYRNGKKGLIGMFMGELMKEPKGQANAQEATKVLTELLS
jgi:aspartyl-tRNA(Asn)/glutamyl-tRNA(Gln) amidotransferase subunit B